MASSIHQPPSPIMRRRLAMSAEHGWLLRLHRSDCTHATGTIARLDRRMEECVVEAPGTLHPEQDVLLDEICDVEVVSVALVHAGQVLARLAVVAAWRGGSQDDDLLIADAISGEISAGDEALVQLSDGVRRRGTITAMQGRRCHIVLAPREA
jgi:hypothetical protein